MSITEATDQKIHKKAFHHRTDSSGELDVFEAARYFSASAAIASASSEDKPGNWRASIDIAPSRGTSLPTTHTTTPQYHHANGLMERKIVKEKKNHHKQPSSPGGRLASFLNSLFTQTSSKHRKSSKSIPATTTKEDEKSPSGRRKRRSSISHFQFHTSSSSTKSSDSKSVYSSSSASGFRTPPAIYSFTPTKSYRGYSDHAKPVVTLRNYGNGPMKSTSLQNDPCDHEKVRGGVDYAWLDEKFKFKIGFSEKKRDLGNGFSEKDRIWADKFPSEERECRKFDDEDEGGDSDSSSDLFELQNCDLGYYASDLPVYETTHMDTIKRGAPISNAQK